MKKIVAITGLKGSGKDEVAKVLIKNFGYKKVAFADLLKDITAQIYGWPREGLEGTTPAWRKWRETIDEHWGISPRCALQKIGTDLIRNQLDQDLWAKRLIQIIKQSKHKKFVITDCRFPNEINILKDSGFDVHFWRIERGERPRWWKRAEYENKAKLKLPLGRPPKYVNWAKENVHASERSWQGLDNPELVIYNNNTLDDLKFKVCNFAVKHLGENGWLMALKFLW